MKEKEQKNIIDKLFKDLSWLKYFLAVCAILVIIFVAYSQKNKSPMPESTTIPANKEFSVSECKITNNGLTNVNIKTLVSFKNEPTSIYAGTGAGIFKSTDNGLHWSPINNGLLSGDTIPPIEIIKKDLRGNLYALTEYQLFRGTQLFVSKNNGANWELISSQIEEYGDWIWSIAPTFSGVYAFVNESIEEDSVSMILLEFNGYSWKPIIRTSLPKAIGGGNDAVFISNSEKKLVYFNIVSYLISYDVEKEKWYFPDIPDITEEYDSDSESIEPLRLSSPYGSMVSIISKDKSITKSPLVYDINLPRTIFYLTDKVIGDIYGENEKGEVTINENAFTYHLAFLDNSEEILTFDFLGKWTSLSQVPKLITVEEKNDEVSLLALGSDSENYFIMSLNYKKAQAGDVNTNSWKVTKLKDIEVHTSLIRIGNKIYIGTKNSGVYQCSINL